MSFGEIKANLSYSNAPEENQAQTGLIQRLIIINKSDLPDSGITFNSSKPTALMDKIELTAGKTGYMLDLVNPNGTSIKYSNEFVQEENVRNGFRHMLPEMLFPVNTLAGREQINFMKDGRFYIVAERRFQGANRADAFLFFGHPVGMEMIVTKDNSNEDSGLIFVTFQTPENNNPEFLPHILLDTDYATTLTAFENKFENTN